MKRVFMIFSAALLVCGLTCCSDDDSTASSENQEQSPDGQGEGGDSGYVSDPSDSSASEIVVYEGDGEVEIGYNETISLDVRRSIADKRYMCVELSTNVKLLGTIQYCPASDLTDITEEYFYTEPGDDPIYQFLDFFRGVQGFSGDAVVMGITLKNVDDAGKLNLKKISFSDRKITDSELYLENEYVKVGVNLNSGGAIHYFERLGRDVKQVYDSSGYGYIIAGDCPDDCKVAYENVNFLNHADTGRLLQQSYYGDVYVGVTWNGQTWCYNPVQGGSTGDLPSQVVDYRVSDNELYTKCIPLDWAVGDKTMCYMEMWVTLEDDGVVKVHNRYTDYTGVEHKATKNQELPALYVSFLLKNFVCYNGNKPFTDDELYRSSTLGYWGQIDGAKTYFSSSNVTEHWSAWLNDDDFGFGIFVAGLNLVVSGRYSGTPEAYNETTYDTALRVFGRDASQMNITDYSTHEAVFSLPTYGTLDYNYFVMVDDLKVMRAKFNALYETEDNDSLVEWVKAHGSL